MNATALIGFGQVRHVRHRPQRNTRLNDFIAVQPQVDRAAHHSNVHLGARDEAQIGIAGVLPYGLQ